MPQKSTANPMGATAAAVTNKRRLRKRLNNIIELPLGRRLDYVQPRLAENYRSGTFITNVGIIIRN